MVAVRANSARVGQPFNWMQEEGWATPAPISGQIRTLTTEGAIAQLHGWLMSHKVIPRFVACLAPSDHRPGTLCNDFAHTQKA